MLVEVDPDECGLRLMGEEGWKDGRGGFGKSLLLKPASRLPMRGSLVPVAPLARSTTSDRLRTPGKQGWGGLAWGGRA